MPHTISGFFDTSPKHRNKPKKNCLVSTHTERQSKQIEFRFVLDQTKKNYLFRGNPNREHFFEIFLVCFGLFWTSSVYFYTGLKHRKKPEKNFGFAKQTKKSVSVCFGWNRKKLIVSRTPYSGVSCSKVGEVPIFRASDTDTDLPTVSNDLFTGFQYPKHHFIASKWKLISDTIASSHKKIPFMLKYRFKAYEILSINR